MLAPAQLAPVWPIAGDVPDLQQIVWSQAKTVMEQELLLHAYQGVLNAAQAVPPATGTGTASGTTSLTVSAVVGIIAVGAALSGTGVAAGLTIVGQASGTPGGNGQYILNTNATITSVLITFTPGGGNSPWPAATDAPTLLAIQQGMTALIRTQTALLQQYNDLLNTSNTSPPPTGP